MYLTFEIPIDVEVVNWTATIPPVEEEIEIDLADTLKRRQG
jgi:hypothetical protein